MQSHEQNCKDGYGQTEKHSVQVFDRRRETDFNGTVKIPLGSTLTFARTGNATLAGVVISAGRAGLVGVGPADCTAVAVAVCRQSYIILATQRTMAWPGLSSSS